MKHSRWILLATAVAFPLLGCGSREDEAPKAVVHAKVDAAEARKVPPAEPQTGAVATSPEAPPAPSADIRRITLSELATKRLGIEFAEIKGNGERMEAPYNALLYDTTGREWVFVSPSPNVFMRTDIKVDAIEGEKVLYSKGPAAGTKVVTLGAMELYGIEFGVGK